MSSTEPPRGPARAPMLSSESPRSLVAFFGHHRCGSSWISAVLEAASVRLGLRFSQVYDSRMFDDDLPAFVEREGTDVLVYMNADWAHAKTLGPVPSIHVVRDPRDILVSAYWSHRYSHPTDYWAELASHRQALESLSLHDGLLAEVECRRQQFREMGDWNYGAEGVLEMRFEQLVTAPLAGLSAALGHLGLVDGEASGRLRTAVRWAARVLAGGGSARRLTPQDLQQVVEEHGFERLSGGRARGDEDRQHHYRKGSPGEWRDVLASQHLEALGRQFPDLVERLGYSTGPATAAGPSPEAPEALT